MRTRGMYRQTFTTGAVTTVTAGTATAGHIFAVRNKDTAVRVLLRALEAEFTLTTAFGAAQRVAFDAFIARDYTAPHTGATALDFTGDTGKRTRESPASVLTGRIADTGALTAGTHALDANPIAVGSAWMGAIGDQLTVRRYDFTADGDDDPRFRGFWLGKDEGLVLRNVVTMGATGVGLWHFTLEWIEVVD
jgi:hypothetical protein